MIPFAMISLLGGVLFAVFAIAAQQVRKSRENLAQLAARLGLEMPPPGTGFFARFQSPVLQGVSRGRPLRIYTYTTGSGKSRTHWCAFAIGVNNASGFTLTISRENLITRAGRIFGSDDVAIGDEAFDREFYVKTNDPAYVQAALLPEIRSQIRQAWAKASRGKVTINGGEIVYAEVGTYSSAKICGRWPELIDLGYVLAEVVEARGIQVR